MSADDGRAESIARGLSKAQARRLNDIFELLAANLSWASKWGSISIRTARATTSALFALGLISDDVGHCRLTPLGLEVRAILQEQAS